MIQLRFLGTTEVRRDGSEVGSVPAGPKRLGLLAYLVLARPQGFQRRDKLLALFWPERGQKAARNSLSNLLYQLRRALGPDLIENRGDEEIRIGRDALWCDALAFERAVDEENVHDACELYGGPLLDGFHVPGTAPTFDQWLEGERDRLKRSYRTVLKGLAEAAEERGDYEEAANGWRERAAEDPFDSLVARRLIEALAAAGNRAEAIETAQAHARLLEDEFGVEPEEMVRSLTADLQEMGTPADRSDPPTEDLDAYRLCSQGQANLDQRTAEGLGRALDCFEQALEADPGFPLAWAGMSEAVSLHRYYRLSPPPDAPSPLAAARKAVELDDGLGEAHTALGIARAVYGEGPAALRALRRAVQRTPSYAEAHIWLGWVSLCLGRPERGLPPAQKAVELNPLAPAFRIFLAEIFLANEQSDAALQEARRARDIQPEYGLAHFMEGLILHHQGRLVAAVSALHRSLAQIATVGLPRRTEVQAALAMAHAADGDEAHAREWETLLDETRDPFSAGLVRGALGDADAAFDTFDQVGDWGSFETEHIRYFYPEVLGPLRADPRCDLLLRRVNQAWGLSPGGGIPEDPPSHRH